MENNAIILDGIKYLAKEVKGGFCTGCAFADKPKCYYPCEIFEITLNKDVILIKEEDYDKSK